MCSRGTSLWLLAVADLAGGKCAKPAKAVVGKLQKGVSQGAWPLSSIEEHGIVDGGRQGKAGRQRDNKVPMQ